MEVEDIMVTEVVDTTVVADTMAVVDITATKADITETKVDIMATKVVTVMVVMVMDTVDDFMRFINVLKKMKMVT